MKTNIVALIFLLGLTSCSTMQRGGLVDENILLKVPIPGSGWTIRSGEKGDESIRMWHKENEWFKVTISHGGPHPEPAQFRIGVDDAARQNLTSNLQSKELKTGLVNNYPMILWQTEATLKDGTKTFNLFLYIKGNDANYYVQRRWNSALVSDSEKQLWIDYMLTISVCDNRYPEHQSPKMEEAWPGLYYDSKSTNGVSK